MKKFRKILSMLLAAVIMFSAATVGANGSFSFKAAAASTQEALNAENELHEKNLRDINSKYDSQISTNKSNAASIMNTYGVTSLNSKSFYDSQSNSLLSKINENQRTIDYLSRDTTGKYAGQIRSLQNTNNEYMALINEYGNLALAVQYLEKAESLENDKARAINNENSRHEQAVQNIKNNQTQEEETKPDTDKPSTDKPVKPQNTKSPLQNLINACLYKVQLDVSLVYLGVLLITTIIGMFK